MVNTLRFDNINMDTSLAEDFLRKTPEFNPIGFPGSAIGYNKYKNKITFDKYLPKREVSATSKDIEQLKPLLLQLAKKIEENIDLFCQLEYLIRKIAPKDVKDYDLRLIIQNLMYYATSNEPPVVVHTKEIIMNEHTPLVSLAYIPQVLFSQFGNTAVIISSIESAVVCWLFTKICHDVGLQNEVFLNIVDETIPKSISRQMDLLDVEDLQSGCHGVVTGKCDLDSAVDTFLASTERLPWKIKRIFVEECVAKRFEQAIFWKAKHEAQAAGDIDSNAREMINKCSAGYRCEGKTILFEYVGSVASCSNAIVVETYRTVKELISLLKAHKPFCLSLWSSDVSESNEISLNVEASIVWINDFGNFVGPALSSQAFFSILDVSVNKIQMAIPDLDHLLKLREAWLRLDVAERWKRIKYHKKDTDEVIPNNSNFNLESFFSATNGSVCYGRRMVSDHVIYVPSSLTTEQLLFITRGGCAVLGEALTNLSEIGAPVCSDLVSVGKHDRCSAVQKMYTVLQNVVYITKAIWTTYGTIFAN